MSLLFAQLSHSLALDDVCDALFLHCRRIVALVEVDGIEREMIFLTNNLTLQLADFLGHNANAMRWQVWMALLLYVLLRFLAWQSK